MKNHKLPSIAFIIIFLSSCSSSKFLNRQYTLGNYKPLNKSIKHNTTKVNSSIVCASISNEDALHSIIKKTTINTQKEIIEQKVEAIVKKDSVFLYHSKGKDKRYLKKCEGTNVLIIHDEYNKRIKTRKINFIPLDCLYAKTDDEKIKALAIKEAKQAVLLSALLWFIPILGIFLALYAKNKITNAKELNPNYDTSTLKIIRVISLFFSFVIPVIVVVFFFSIFWFLFFGGYFI